MYEVPGPTHGFFGVTVAFLAYVAIVVALAVGLSALELSSAVVLGGTVVAAVGILAGFVPLFRRLTPTRAGSGDE